MRGQTTKPLLISTATALAGVLAGFIAGSEVGGLNPNNINIILDGATVEVHAVDLRQKDLTDGGRSATLQAWGAAKTADGGAYDLGSVLCDLDPAAQTLVTTLLAQGNTCAAGDAGVDPLTINVHAIDLRRLNVPDGGTETSAKAWGSIQNKGATEYLPEGVCPMNSIKAISLVDGLGRECFRKAKGLAK